MRQIESVSCPVCGEVFSFLDGDAPELTFSECQSVFCTPDGHFGARHCRCPEGPNIYYRQLSATDAMVALLSVREE